MSNPWLAIDVATAPAQRAREVRRAWERFVEHGWSSDIADESAYGREPILASWRRSAAAGVDPSGGRSAPVVADADETSARWEVHPLAEIAPLIRSCLAATADESGHLIVVSDANGVLLWVEGNARVRFRAADSMNFAEGTLWSEGGAGTNAIGTALAAEHAVQVFAAEHFNEIVQAWTCAAAPVCDPDTGRVIGVIDLTGEMATVHPHSMAVATATAQAVEAELRCQMLDRDGRLLARYGDRLSEGPEPRALVTPSGRVIASQPVGWLPRGAPRAPPGGGQLPLDDGRSLLAEALGCEEAYLVRACRRAAPSRAARAAPRLHPARPWPRDRGARRQAPGASVAPQRDAHAAVRQPRRTDERGAERGRLRAPRWRRQDPGRGLAAAQAARRLHRVRALPGHVPGLSDVAPSAACCTAAMCGGPRGATTARSCPVGRARRRRRA